VVERLRRLSLERLEQRALLAMFVVTDPGNSGPGTLRDAIEQANMTPDLDDITFALPLGSETITLTEALPNIIYPVTMDAGDPGASNPRNVALVTTSPDVTDGLVVTGGGTTIAGLAIGGFSGAGIVLRTAGGNNIRGNFIGLSRDGAGVIGNGMGILVQGSAGNTIGGTSAGARNVISGNTGDGIRLLDSGSSSNTIQGNLIGMLPTGLTAAPNANGIVLDTSTPGAGGAPTNLIGGTLSGARNIISANTNAGIVLRGPGTTNNSIQGNDIGTNFDTTTGPGNGYGVLIADGAANNTVGGSSVLLRNIISGNLIHAVWIDNASNNVVNGNIIGLNRVGDTAFPNGSGVDPTAAVRISNNSSGNRIGGLASADANIISGNLGDGIFLDGGATETTRPRSTLIQGNRIGTNASGNVAIPNGRNGIQLATGTDNTIGGSTTSARNIISGNALNGIYLASAAVVRTTIQNNHIGIPIIDPNIDLGNAGAGILVSDAVNTVIGETFSGTSTTTGNVIAFNDGAGVRVSSSATNTAIRRNSIHSNGALGIDVGSVGPDPSEVPVITLVQTGGTNTVIQGTIQAEASKSYVIDLYSNLVADPSGFGQGRTFLTSVTVTTNASGFANFSATTTTAVAVSAPVSATWTASEGGTSEFAADVVNTAPEINLSLTLTDDPDPAPSNGVLTYTIVVTNPSSFTATNVVITDTLASGVTFIAGKSSLPATITQSGQVVRFTIGNLAPMSSVTVMLTTVPPNAGTISNTAEVDATENDSDQSDNAATITTTVVASVDLVASGIATPSTGGTPGTDIAYIVSITNSSPRDATNVVLTSLIPAGTTFVSVTASSGTASESGGTITAELGTLAPTATAQVTILVRPGSAGTFVLSATATSTELDSFPLNNTAVIRAEVAAPLPPQPGVSPPRVIEAVRQPSQGPGARIVLTFSQTMNPSGVVDRRGYQVLFPGHDGIFGNSDDIILGIRSVQYNALNQTVRIRTTGPAVHDKKLQVIARGTGPYALKSTVGVALDGDGNGMAGSDFIARLAPDQIRTYARRNPPRAR
jgi:uncharacterized repeat protein (TIGR01451 family)